MTFQYIIRESVLEDAAKLHPNLRPADVLECKGLGVVPMEALKEATYGPDSYTLVADDGYILGMFGLGEFIPDPGLSPVWLLGTDLLVAKHARQFLRDSRNWINQWSWDRGTLGNIVHRENVIHHRWLEWLGFTIYHKNPFMSLCGHIYFPFTRSHTCVNQ